MNLITDNSVTEVSNFVVKCSPMSSCYRPREQVIPSKLRFFKDLPEGRKSPSCGIRVAELTAESRRVEVHFLYAEVILIEASIKSRPSNLRK
jgi:hypothetical protein